MYSLGIFVTSDFSGVGLSCAVQISDFLLDLTLKQIIPHMEQKIRMLNQQVSAEDLILKCSARSFIIGLQKPDNCTIRFHPFHHIMLHRCCYMHLF